MVMLCEDVPSEASFDSGQGSISPGARSSGGSQSGDLEHGIERSLSNLSRDGFSYRKVYVSDAELPWRQPCYLLSQTVHQPYECSAFRYFVHIWYLILCFILFKKLFVNVHYKNDFPYRTFTCPQEAAEPVCTCTGNI